MANLIHRHERELAQHEASVASLRADLRHARLRHEQIDVVRRKKLSALDLEHRARERKREDQQASQAWLRRRLSQGNATAHPS